MAVVLVLGLELELALVSALAPVVRTRVTTTTLLGHPEAEKVMFCVYVPAPNPSVCGVIRLSEKEMCL